VLAGIPNVTSNISPDSRIPTITVGLRPFDFSPPIDGKPPTVSALLATFSARPDGGIRFVFVLEARLEALRVPAAGTAGEEPLWRHTCFEAFLAAPGADEYREYNFSPAGRWAASQFRRYREIDHALEADAPPVIVISRHDDVLALEVDLPAALAPDGPLLRVGLTAVIEHGDGYLEYWAVHHPGERADFHHAGGWVLQLDRRWEAS
jgi:hypothetical protein